MQPDLLAIGAIALLCILALLVWNTRTLAKLVGGATTRLSALEHGLSRSNKGLDEHAESAGAAAIEPLETERDELLGAQDRLTEELRQVHLEGQENRQLYLLMKGLLDRHELLRAARVDATSVTPSAIARRAAKPTGGARSTSGGSATRSRTSEDLGPFVDDKEHQTAARMARVMVADLFLYNPKATEAGITEDELRSRLKVSYRAARETYESRVADRVRKEKDYLDMEFERAVNKRSRGPEEKPEASAPEKPAKEPEEPVGEDEEHHRAARLARLMIADLFLGNWALVEKGVREGNLRELLDPAFQEARRNFESHVAKPVWDETHYFDVHFEQVLWESQGHLLDSEFDRALRERLPGHSPNAAAGR
jgi:hypothetical protein